ncbi:tudor domain-containing 6-like [Nematolebias whitei]|uniref:tudor domain-containing 6-like n=1 Tax=Nematolebias whitei TaxID=451745 RepID=UPI00189B336C|nr:tudor domain-containing 6-like [Nematolebias whitei]
MCSIPGLPSPGLEVSVLITRVNLKSSHGLLELWVNMDDGKKCIYEQMKEEIQTPQRSFYRSEGKPGDLCVVCIKDKWHRARIVSIQSETYNVFLIDQSQPHATTSEALAWSKSGSFLLPPEIELCILANVMPLQNEWPETASKFLMCLPRKKFKGLVQDVFMPDRIILLEIPVVANYMCKLGVAKKIKADQSKGLLQKYLHAIREDLSESLCLTLEPEPDVPCHFVQCDHYFYPELTIDTFETVYVTEIINPLNIFCMLFIFSKAVKLLSEQIHQHYEESSYFGPAQPQSCGDPCAARGTDGKWCRSLLKQNIETSEDAAKDDIEVFHVDAGKTELVKAEDIRPLHGKFLKMPVVTYLCSLNKITNTNREEAADKTDDLKSMLLNQMVVARFDHYNKHQDVYYVTLYSAYDACLNDIFLEKAGPVSFSESEQASNVHNNALFPISLEEKKTIDLLFKAKKIDGFQEETGSGTKIQVGNDRVDDSSTSGNITRTKISAVPVLHNNGHLSSSLLSEVQNACDDSVFPVGKTVHVKVSCIESPQKFWCQETESADSFRQLMQDLQAHYAFAHPQPLVESICVARNPENKMWYRASIVARHDTPTVDVRFIDYGQTQSIPLRDVHPIDPVFLQLKAQAFQCCLFILNNPTEPTHNSWTDAEFNEFLKFVDPGTSSDTELKCLVKAVTSDEDGLLVNVVDIQRESESVCELLTQKRAQSKVQEQMPSAISLDGYCYSTLNIEVGGEEKVLVTSAKTVRHFYCQLHRNAHVLDKLIKNIAKLFNKPQSLEDTPELNSICLARHIDKWYRGQIVETSPKLKVHFVDYGDTLAISKSSIYPFPSGSSVARFVPVQAIPLALFDMPADLPQDVNQWFADFAVGHSFTISVVAKSEERKLIVELFDGSLSVNIMVREKVEKIKLARTCMNQNTDEHLSVGSKAALPDGDSSDQELNEASVIKTTEQEDDHSWNTHKDSPPQMEQEKVLDGRNPTLGVVSVKETIAEISIQDSPSFLKMSPHSTHVCPEGKGKIYRYKWPTVSQNMIVDAHASYIVGPDHFWCQYTNTEDLTIVTKFAEEAGQAHTVFPSGELEPGSQCIAFSNNLWYRAQLANTEDLDEVSQLAQEAGQAEQDIFSKSLSPGSPCLALFPSDNQWYRAQVLHKSEETLHVLFVDYGNESEVDIKNVKPLTQCLLEIAPQAFLCCLSGFDKSKGSWKDDASDAFYNLLVDKPLKLSVVDMNNHSEIAVPQYSVEIEHEEVNIHAAMLQYWKPVTEDSSMTENQQSINSSQVGPDHSDTAHLCVSKTTLMKADMFKDPMISRAQTEMIYASCISEPSFFWCQLANTEDLDEVSQLSQEAGQAEQDTIFSKALGPGSPCLALFPSDNQWYRAQLVRKSEKMLHVLFVDYGNESEVDVKNVKPLTQSLLEIAPQAFLCCLSGFDESKGSWKDEASDAFYNLLVDKPLKLSVVDMKDHSEIAVPQYSVEIEHEGVVVNMLMEKYWRAESLETG